MNNAALDILFTRRPVLNYISPAVCEAIFSSTSFPTLILEAIPRRAGITGLRVGSWGTNGVFRLRWDVYPGALCYTVYRLNDANDPLGDYSIVAECISDPEYDPELYEFPFNPEGACYLITAITPEGETPIGEPICPFSCLSNGGDLPQAEIAEPYSYQLVPAEIAPVDITSWTVILGSLPSGLTLSNTGLISGTVPSEIGVDGTYDFTVLVTTNLPDPENPPNVITCSADCRIVVPEEVGGGFCIANDTPLPSGEVGEVYSVQLIPGSVEPVLQWTVIGTLPPGLVLDFDTGLISGTPSETGTFNFTIQVQEVIDGNPAGVCDKDFQLTIEGGCATFLDLVYDAPGLTEIAGGTASSNGTLNVIHLTASAPAQPAVASVSQVATVEYTGDEVDCNVEVNLVQFTSSASGSFNNCLYSMTILVGATEVLNTGTLQNANNTGATFPGVYNFPFTIPASVAETITVTINLTSNVFTSNPGSSEAEAIVTIGSAP